MAVSATSLPFREQNEFLRRKLNLPTNGWTDVYGRENDYAFVVAGANRNDLVADFHQAVQRAIEGGTTLEAFRQDFDRIVAKYGWSYNGGRNWRSRVIYETNMRSSYMAGRYEQLLAVREERPYWQYLHSDAVEYPREEHEAWNGMVLRWDDPWWQYHFPINAWGCQCSVRALSDDDLVRMGKTGPDTAPPIVFEQRTIGQRSPQGPRTVEVPVGIDPGFEHIPGQSRLESQVPVPRPGEELIPSAAPGLPNRRAPDALPVPRVIDPETLPPAGMSDAEYARRALDAFGAQLDAAELLTDVLGERIAVGPSMFQQPSGAPAVQSQGELLPLLAETLLQPDEIWTRLEYSEPLRKSQVLRRYLGRFNLGQQLTQLVVIELAGNAWSWDIEADREGLAELLRQGVRLYRRED
ncbi:PBECR2 nuclease fold domain-containing protein [Pseudomonas sp. B111]|uniref:PBECR2 nuclease fold domain-containing protein n=1 Tax=Pseudomonas sp. B111 TaxID=2944252 RepID=UPI0022642AD3|nr:PBECR2 nuclease fold domain-containing protein [Pseudomonas sp. B111]UZX36755.1 PBECR2 nuclease fold domain-containing protein [Pseudomonas sp. B111]